MNSILSLLLCLVIAMSGGYMTEDTAVRASRVTTISDIAVTINGEEYPIDLSAMIGAKSENGEGVIAFEMYNGDQTLFPVQAKISADGMGVLLGQSTTNYTFTDDLLDAALTVQAGFTPEVEGFLNSYVSLLTQAMQASYQNMGKPVAVNEEANQQLWDYVLSIANDLTVVSSSVVVDGVDVASENTSFSLDTGDCILLLDYVLDMAVPGMTETLLDMMTQAMAMEGETFPEAASLNELVSALATAEGTEIPADLLVLNYEQNLTPDMQGIALLEIVGNDEGMSVSLPMTIEFANAEHFSFSSYMTIPETGLDMGVEGVVDGSDIEYSMFYVVDDEYMPIEYAMQASMQFNDDGSYIMEAMVSENLGDGMTVTMSELSNVDAEMNAAAEVGIEIYVEDESVEEPISIAATFHMDNTAGDFEDRISDAKVTEINTDEEIENATGLALAAVGLAGDVEKLMANESIVAIVDAVNALVPETEVEYYDNYEGSEDPADLPFTVPTFAYLPEGYSVDETSESAYTSDYYSNYSVSLYDENYNMICLSMNGYDDATEYSTYLLNADDSISQSDSTILDVQISEGMTEIYWTSNGVFMDLYTFDSNLDLDTMFEIVKGISFEMKAE